MLIDHLPILSFIATSIHYRINHMIENLWLNQLASPTLSISISLFLQIAYVKARAKNYVQLLQQTLLEKMVFGGNIQL